VACLSFFLLKLKKDFFFFLPSKSVIDPVSEAEQDSSTSSNVAGLPLILSSEGKAESLILADI